MNFLEQMDAKHIEKKDKDAKKAQELYTKTYLASEIGTRAMNQLITRDMLKRARIDGRKAQVEYFGIKRVGTLLRDIGYPVDAKLYLSEAQLNQLSVLYKIDVYHELKNLTGFGPGATDPLIFNIHELEALLMENQLDFELKLCHPGFDLIVFVKDMTIDKERIEKNLKG